MGQSMNDAIESENGGRLTPPISVVQLRARIARIDSLVIDLDKLEDNISFFEAGADSLDLFSIISEIEEAAGFNIPDEDIEKVSTLSDLANYLNARMT